MSDSQSDHDHLRSSSPHTSHCDCRRIFRERERRKEALERAKQMLADIDYSPYIERADQALSLPSIVDSNEMIVQKLEIFAPLIIEGRSLAVISGYMPDDIEIACKQLMPYVDRLAFEAWERGEFHRAFDPNLRDRVCEPLKPEDEAYIEAMKKIWPGNEISPEHFVATLGNGRLLRFIRSVAQMEATRVDPTIAREVFEYQAICITYPLLKELGLRLEGQNSRDWASLTVSERVRDALRILRKRERAVNRKHLEGPWMLFSYEAYHVKG
jgi:hypothetical protein